MRYYSYLSDEDKKKYFFKEPCDFNKCSNIDTLRYAIGALLYVPAINKEMIIKCIEKKIPGILNFVICLEDAIGKDAEEEAIVNLMEALDYLRENGYEEKPLVFIRPKDIHQFKRLTDILVNNTDIINGIVIPKANGDKIISFINMLDEIGCRELFIMPIIETTEFIDIYTKKDAIKKLYYAVREYKDRILNIRIGVTDILGAYSLRRNKEFTIYDNLIYSTLSTDILKVMTRGEVDIPVSGGVSELYNLRDKVIYKNYVKEVKLDKLNGYIGKTAIHPLQVKLVQAMSVVNYEDYIDAISILNNIESKFSIESSLYKNRMNEVNPHLRWARRTLKLADIYGVLNERIEFDELFEVSMEY